MRAEDVKGVTLTDAEGAFLFPRDIRGPESDPGFVIPTPPAHDVYAREMAATFPELGPNAAVDMHWPVPTIPRTELAMEHHAREAVDREYDNFKYFLRKRSF